MKKILSILMTLCVLFAAVPALAEDAVPTLDSMPAVIVYDNLEEPDIALFNGTWEPTEYIFTDGVFVELENIITAFNPPKILIGDGVIFFDDMDSDGNVTAVELTGTLDAGQLTAEYNGDDMIFQLLEDGNIVLDLMVHDDNATVDITVFYVRDEHIDED